MKKEYKICKNEQNEVKKENKETSTIAIEGDIMIVIDDGCVSDARASTTYTGNSILIMENSYSGGYETLETPNMFLNPSI